MRFILVFSLDLAGLAQFAGHVFLFPGKAPASPAEVAVVAGLPVNRPQEVEMVDYLTGRKWEQITDCL